MRSQAVHMSSIMHTDAALPVLQRVAGKDASKQFWKYHNDGILKKYKAQLQVGSLDTKAKPAAPPTPPATPPPQEGRKEAVKPSSEGPAAPFPGPAAKEAAEAEALEPYGDLIPYADPAWYQGVCDCHVYTLGLSRLNSHSITLHISIRLTSLFVPRFESGSIAKLSHMSLNGMRRSMSPIAYTNKWASVATWLGCWVYIIPSILPTNG